MRTLTLELTEREARCLRHMGEIFAGAFEDAGCDLTDVDLLDGTQGISPLVSACMRIELALITAGAEI